MRRWLVVLGMLAIREAAAETCPALHVTVPAKLDLTSKKDAPIPDVTDFGTSLDSFYVKLAQVARGTPGVKLRIGTYGDSNWTNDKTAGEIRRRLQLAFGDAGHGFIAFGRPWGWYYHQNVQHGTTGRWSAWNPTAMPIGDGMYGFAGVSTESSQAGATAWVETAKSGEPVGTAVGSFELHYLARPKGGTFEVLVDGESKETIDTANATNEMKFARYAVKDGAHRLTVKVVKGGVRLFGVALERDVTGIVVDGIGMNALNPLVMKRFDQAQLSAGLTRRGYDLLIETTGTNVWSPYDHKTLMPDLIAQFRAALPHASLMLWSPPDFVRMTKTEKPISEPFMKMMAVEKKKMAEAAKIGWWDQYEALGGYGSAPRWTAGYWYEGDGVHMGPKINAYVGERFVHAVLAELARRIEKDPRLGCKSGR